MDRPVGANGRRALPGAQAHQVCLSLVSYFLEQRINGEPLTHQVLILAHPSEGYVTGKKARGSRWGYRMGPEGCRGRGLSCRDGLGAGAAGRVVGPICWGVAAAPDAADARFVGRVFA